jgi:Cu2+-exporting ATPase
MSETTVLHVGGLHWATSQHAIEATLMRQAGVEAVEANAANQSATVTYDPAVTSVGDLAGWVRDCGYHCAGRSVPTHVCEPMVEPAVNGALAEHGSPHGIPHHHAEHSAQELMGHGGSRGPVDGRDGPGHAQPVPRRGGSFPGAGRPTSMR